jgi:trigger factor
MLEAEYQNILNQIRHEASHEADPQAALAEIEKDAEEYRHIAERRVRLGLLLSEIGGANGVTVSEQEMNRLIMQAAQQYQGEEQKRFLELVQQEPMFAAQLRAPLYEDKVVDFLFSKAEITERTGSRSELEADLEAEEGHVHGPGCGHDHAAEAVPSKAEGAEKPKGAKGKKPKAEPTAAEDTGPEGPGAKVGSKPAKSAKGKPTPDKVKLTEEPSEEPKPAKPLKSEPANKAAAAKADTKSAAKKPPAKKGK